MGIKPIILVLAAIFIAAIFIFIYIRINKKIKNYIMKRFGKIPNNADLDLNSVKSYHYYIDKFTDTSAQVDSITWSDLDMDDVYKRINACHTSIGEEYLYQMLHEPNFDEDKLKKREELIEYLKNNTDKRLKIQIYLAKLGKYDYNGISSCIFDVKSKLLKHSWIYKILMIVPLICVGVIFINTVLGMVLLILSALANGIIYSVLNFKLEKELSITKYFSAMLWSCNKICKIQGDKISDLTANLKKEYNVFKFLKGRISRAYEKGTSEVAILAESIYMIFLTDIRQYNRIMDKINKETQAFHKLFKELGEIDVAICILSFRESLKHYCIPAFAKEKTIAFDGLYHPLLKEPITNDGRIDNHSIITGPNASGKSTFIKSLAVNSILAQTIYTCTALKYTLGYSLVMTSMAVRDNIMEGDSYFITEIKSLKRVIDKINEVTCTCFIDEILRGTNTIERIAASSSILKYLNDKDCLCMVASHDIELTKIMEDLYDNYHFSEKVDDDGVSFDFKLKDGVTTTSNAIKLLGFMEFDSAIVDRAKKNVDDFLATGSW